MTNRSETGRVALVLGATGGIGGEMSRQLRAAGWRVRALHRQAARQREAAANAGQAPGGIEWIQGDAMSRADVVAAATGAAVIVHAVNPPGYRRWNELVLPMVDNTIAAARACGARIVLPGTVYNFGPDAFAGIRETSPQRPRTAKGAIRVEMEARLQAAATQGVRTLVVRAGDFFGPGAANNWFSQLVKPGKPVTSVTYPGRIGVGHQWAYLPDVAGTMMALIARESELEDFAVFHMRGHWDPDGGAMTAAIGRAVGRERLPVRRFPWWLVSATAWAVPLFRELKEMRYLWERPVFMPNDRLVGFLGREPHTPLDEAVRATLQGLACLDGSAATASDVTRPAVAPRRFA